MPNVTMSDREDGLRRSMESAVQELLKTIRRCPRIDDLDLIDDADVDKAVRLATDAMLVVRRLQRDADILDQLDGLTPDGVMIVETTRSTLAMVEHLMTVLAAAVDTRATAA